MYRLSHAPGVRVRVLVGALVSLLLLSACGPASTATVMPTAAATISSAPATPTVALPAASVTPAVTSVLTVETATPTATATTSAVTAVPTASREIVPTATPLPSCAFPVVYAVVGVASDDVLNVRAGPGVAHAIVGTIPPYGMGVQIAGESQLVGESSWVPVALGDLAGWVNGRYLAQQVGWADEAVAARANEIVQALRDRDWAAVARVVHPDKGVRFSPYAYVRAGPGAPGELDRVVRADEIEALAADRAIFRWGRFDGTGDPIDLDFAGYVDRFVYDADYAQPHTLGYDERVGWGNTIDNTAEVYPEAVTVGYHFTGFDPQFGGMDWRSLRLVLEEQEGEWYLVGVVHDEWTI
jgi:uncharacterized protein YgiM (DUF1202 family)